MYVAVAAAAPEDEVLVDPDDAAESDEVVPVEPDAVEEQPASAPTSPIPAMVANAARLRKAVVLVCWGSVIMRILVGVVKFSIQTLPMRELRAGCAVGVRT